MRTRRIIQASSNRGCGVAGGCVRPHTLLAARPTVSLGDQGDAAGLWDYRSQTWARKSLDKWFAWAKRSQLQPVKKVADMIKSRIDNVLAYCRHAVTNGVAEGLNSRIMTIKRKCCGFRNVENFKTAIYFHCGGLDLYPL